MVTSDKGKNPVTLFGLSFIAVLILQLFLLLFFITFQNWQMSNYKHLILISAQVFIFQIFYPFTSFILINVSVLSIQNRLLRLFMTIFICIWGELSIISLFCIIAIST